MIARLATFAALALPLAAPDEPRPAGGGPAPRWRVDGERVGVEVVGLDAANLAELARPGRDPASWAAFLAVGVEAKAGPLRPMAGRYRVEGQFLRFEPTYPADRDVSLVARLDPGRLPRPVPGPVETIRFDRRQESPRAATTRVVRVDPGLEVLPENLLKFYLHFSGPMSRGEAYRRVRILDGAGRPLDAPFLEIGEELWNDAGTRLTILLDPGRIKRGLVPREEDGPILAMGRSYTLVIDRDWPDAGGCPLVGGFRKPFRAGPLDEAQPDPKTWTLDPPAAGTRGPLALGFPEPLDRAMLGTSIVVVDGVGRRVAGRVAVADDGRGWSFEPDAPWQEGDYRAEVNPELEDLVGNSVARPFEVDVVRPIEPPTRVGPVVLPFSVRARPRG